MSLRIPTPSPSLDQAAQACATQLRGHSFAGDFTAFWSTWNQYLEEHGQEDPHGRLAMRHITNVSSGLLGYRSLSTDRQELARQTRARWETWMKVLPFDHQLNLVLDEYSPHQLHEIDFAWLKWNDWHALRQSANPDETFRHSSMGGWKANSTPGTGSPKTQTTVNGRRGAETHDISMSPHAFQNHQQTKIRMMWAKLLSSKAWERADEWLQVSGFDVNSVMSKAWAHHETRGSRGATQVQFHTPQPAWLSAVFAGASEPEFWQHLARAGGPPNAAQALAHIDGKLGSVADLFKPSVALSDEAVSRLLETAAQWRAQAMDVALDAPAVAQRVRRF